MTSLARSVATLVALALAACTSAPDTGPVAVDEPELGEDHGEKVFNHDAVQELALELDTAAMATMNAEMAVIDAHRDLEHMSAKRTQAKGKLTYAGVAYDVQVKIKGMWSAQGFDHKPSLKIEFDKSFFGLKNLTLNAMVQDATMVRETLAYRMYEAVGVAVPRVGYSQITINGAPYGLYLTLESIDKNFLTRHFGDDKGIVYEGTYGGDLRESAIGTANLVHQSDKTNPDEEATHARLKELIAAVNARGDDLFYGPSPLVETETFLSMMAMAYIIGDWDNYISANNYRLHRHATTGRWSFIPTGTDQSLQRAMHPYRPNGEGAFPVLFEKCMGSKRCVAGYDAALARAITAFQAPDGSLTGTMARRMALIDAAAAHDPRKPYDANAMKAARDKTIALIRSRPDDIARARSCMAGGHETFAGACAGVLLVNARDKMCADLDGFSLDDGHQAHAWDCHGHSNQRWGLAPVGSGEVKVITMHAEKCLDVDGALQGDGVAVVQRTCNGTPQQTFAVKDVAGGFHLVAKHSGKCLDLSGPDPHANLTQEPCSGAPSQVWTQRSSMFE
jgi:hypothetical protein